MTIITLLFAIVIIFVNCQCAVVKDKDNNFQSVANKPLERSAQLARNFIEQGRTFIHHAMKRMAMLVPVIFFKLGIAFTLLILVTIVSVNNGVIGFMLLVVGLSSVLSRLQETKHALGASPFVLPPTGHYHVLDRSDGPALPTPASKSEYYPHTDIAYHRYTK